MNKKALFILMGFAVAIGVFGLIWTPGALAGNSEITAEGGSYSILGGQDHQGAPFSAIPTALPGQRGLYAVDDSTDSFYKIDPYSGVTTLIGPCVEDLSLSGLAYDTSTGTMYVSDVTLGGMEWGLGTIDLATGEVTIIGSHVISMNIWGLAYDSSNDILYGSDFNNGGLASIDRATGAATLIGTFVSTSWIRGLAYCPVNDTLYGIDETNLYTIDRATGEATVVGAHGITTGGYIGLEYDENTGRLYAACSNSPDLYFLGMTNGIASPIGPTGIQISGLASIPATGYRSVLYVNTMGGLDSDFIADLLGMDIDGLSIVNAQSITPPVAYMQNFNVVLVSTNTALADPLAMGNNLADYVDAGGGVLLFMGTLALPDAYGLEGKIITPDYSPLPKVTFTFGVTSTAISFESHPITSGVTSLWTTVFDHFTATQGTGQSLGDYDTGYFLGAYNPDKPIVVINVIPGNGVWGGDLIQMTENAINWLAPLYTVEFISGANGSITGDSIQEVLEGDDCTAVTAVPDADCVFLGWTGDYTGTDNPLTITNVTSDMTITANFAPLYTVTFVAGANGSITGDLVQQVVEGSNCTAVTAVPDSGYDFDGWTGDYTGTTNPLTITNVTQDMTITANFEAEPPPPGGGGGGCFIATLSED